MLLGVSKRQAGGIRSNLERMTVASTGDRI